MRFHGHDTFFLIHRAGNKDKERPLVEEVIGRASWMLWFLQLWPVTKQQAQGTSLVFRLYTGKP